MISAIVVIGKNREIGYNNQLLWNIPEDMSRFKKLTDGHVVIMGDKTYESIGAPLPGRINIIMSLDKNYQAKGCSVVHTIDEALKMAKEKDKKGEIFIIGGGTIYKILLPRTDKLYLTLVDDAPDADVFFPDYSEFKNTVYEKKRQVNGMKYTFLELTR